jgi:hypothetical protein
LPTRLERLATKLNTVECEALDIAPRLWLGRAGESFLVDFFGDPSEDAYCELVAALTDPEVASHVATLSLRGPDAGANGTRNWDLTPLVAATFPRLMTLAIEGTLVGAHNRTIVASIYEEDGVLAALLANMPALESLQVPSAPNAAFFKVGERPLRWLSVDTGYDHQDFICNLATSSCFPRLRALAFGEYAETYMDDFADHVTPLADYVALFASPVARQLHAFTWRNPALADDQIALLVTRCPGLTVQVVRTSSSYVRKRLANGSAG